MVLDVHQQNWWSYLRVSTPYTIIQSIQKFTQALSWAMMWSFPYEAEPKPFISYLIWLDEKCKLYNCIILYSSATVSLMFIVLLISPMVATGLQQCHKIVTLMVNHGNFLLHSGTPASHDEEFQPSVEDSSGDPPLLYSPPFLCCIGYWRRNLSAALNGSASVAYS
jgi:hypothetical protein